MKRIAMCAILISAPASASDRDVLNRMEIDVARAVQCEQDSRTLRREKKEPLDCTWLHEKAAAALKAYYEHMTGVLAEIKKPAN